MSSVGCESMNDLKAALPAMRSEMRSREGTKALYAFGFKYYKESSSKVLSAEVAVALWKVLLPPLVRSNGEDGWPLCEQWCAFIEGGMKASPVISNDLWTQTLKFAQEFPDEASLSGFDEDGMGAWPCLIDDFVEGVQEKMKKEKR